MTCLRLPALTLFGLLLATVPALADGSPPAAWNAFLAGAFALAPTDFARVRGSEMPNLKNRFATTFPADPAFARNCVIERFPGNWTLDCELTGYQTDPVQAAKDAIAVLGPAFVGHNVSLGSMHQYFLQRPADYFEVSILRSFTNDPAHIWVTQSIHIQNIAPDSVPAVPIIGDTSTTGQPREQLVGTGTVISRDAKGSYVLGVLDASLGKGMIVGSHIGPGHWQLRPASIVARDADSHLALLRVEPALNTAPAIFGNGIALGTSAQYTVFRDCFITGFTMATDFVCAAITSPVRIAAQRANGTELEYQGGGMDWPGAPLRDDGGKVLAIASHSLDTAVGANVAIALPSVQRFLAQHNVAVAAQASATNKPPAEVAALLPSVVRIQAGTNEGTGVVVRGPGGAPIVLTAAHVVGELRFAYVYTASGERREARVLRADSKRDLAVLTVSSAIGPALGFAPALHRGMRLLTIGFPRSSYQFTGVVTPKYGDGLVSSFDTERGLISYTVPTDEGNSGGALFDPVSHTVAGIVLGEFGNGGFVGADVSSIRHFLDSLKGL
jgi:S1-C subfamily serine protease